MKSTDPDSGDYIVVSANAMKRTYCETMDDGVKHAEHLLRGPESCSKLYVVQIVAEVERPYTARRRDPLIVVRTRAEALASRCGERVEAAQKAATAAILKLVEVKKRCTHLFKHTCTTYCVKVHVDPPTFGGFPQYPWDDFMKWGDK